MKTELDTNPLDKLPPIRKQDLDKNLCTCMDVPKMDVINAIVNGATAVEAVKRQASATMGGGCCVQQIERFFEHLCKEKTANESGFPEGATV
jgi:NAD(P)H-nitrite reductase large subunit